MMNNSQLSEFGTVLLFILGGIVFLVLAFLAASMLRPHKPNSEKLTAYECGEEPAGTAWGPFNSRFYAVALIFVLFDVELVFLFPWAVVFGQEVYIETTGGLWGWFTLAEMFIFIGMLALGLAYAWARGYLDWVRPDPVKPAYKSPVPPALYRQVNERKYAVRERKDG